jgi:hypothetical protein
MPVSTTPTVRVRKPVKAEIERDKREEMVARVLAAVKIDPPTPIKVKLLVSRAGPNAAWRVGDETMTRSDRATRMFAAGEAAPADEMAQRIFDAIGADERHHEEMP